MLVGSTSGKSLSFNHQGISDDKVRCLVVKNPNADLQVKSSRTRECAAMFNMVTRRDILGLAFGVSSSLLMNSFEAKGAGLPPEEKPKLCDESCEKELENVW